MTHPIIAPSAVPAVIDKFKKIIEVTKDQIEFCECRIDEDCRDQWVLTTHNGTSFLRDLEAAYGPAYHDQWNAAGLIHETPIFVPSQNPKDRIRLRRWPEIDERFKKVRLVDACAEALPRLRDNLATYQDWIEAGTEYVEKQVAA